MVTGVVFLNMRNIPQNEMKLIPIVLLCLGLTLNAQAAAPASKPTPAVAVKLPTKASLPKKSIELFGGSPEDFIELLSDGFPHENIHERTSFLIPTKDIKLPTLRVHTDSAEKVLLLYNRLSEVRPEWGEWIWDGDFNDAAAIVLIERKGSPQQIERASTLAAPPTSFTRKLRSTVSDSTTAPNKPSLFGGTINRGSGTVTSMSRPSSKSSSNPYSYYSSRPVSVAKQPAPLVTRVYATGRLDENGIESIMVAVKEAMGMLAEEQARLGQPPEKAPRLRYHPGSKAVIAVGTTTALQVVEEVITAIAKSVDKDSSTADPFNRSTSTTPRPPKPAKPARAVSPF